MKRLSACHSGTALANSGETPSARDKSRTRFAPPMQEAKGRRRIALGLGTSLPPAVMAYVTSACRRMGADLTVLCASTDTAATLLAPYLAVLAAEAIGCDTVELDVKHKRALVRHLSADSRVLFAVSGGADDPVQSLIGDGRRGPGAAPVPIVVVTSEQG
jgi:hypothetical protein